MTSDTYILKSLQHALQILDLLSKNESMGITEICRILKQSKSSVFRILFTLEAAGYVIKTPEAKYRLSIKFAHYGNAVLERHDILTIARPFLKELSQFHIPGLALRHTRSQRQGHFPLPGDAELLLPPCVQTPGYQMDATTAVPPAKMLLSQVPQEELEYFAHKYTYKQLTPSH
jgi:DNA-binding transcriptional ArsR family regulator